jgi:hypothetical protein
MNTTLLARQQRTTVRESKLDPGDTMAGLLPGE